ncbi:hypothetical protein AG1IA_08985 [Rhizoctonia solani AG-1 IA]|uniref:Uncharacterized protein n=1 Tax=Thanatephorus cucumeris (strain AG1-IA) TaxID=983506 RepID=L8WJJ6_THACA|nr:hypothetical protein AG1IA_08985 [Rhizoctonia solani AG-1 IA]
MESESLWGSAPVNPVLETRGRYKAPVRVDDLTCGALSRFRYIICLHSTLCSRILLSLRVFNAELQSSAVTGIASSASRTANSFGNDLHLRGKGDGAYQTMGVRKGTHDFDYEMQDRPIELERLQRS